MQHSEPGLLNTMWTLQHEPALIMELVKKNTLNRILRLRYELRKSPAMPSWQDPIGHPGKFRQTLRSLHPELLRSIS
jgi:hypothetical protein